MADEDENHNPPAFVFALGTQPSPEQIEQMQQQAKVAKHEMYRVFGELKEDQLQALRGLFNICSSPDGKMYAEHFEGIAVGILHARFDICITCGVNHEKEAFELDGGPKSE